MTARGAYTELLNLTRGLKRTATPVLPPALGFGGDTEYMQQLEIWKKWIQWEKDDPLVLKDDDPAEYKKRIFYVYKQATMVLRFWPDVWYEASEWCFNNGMDSEGNDMLNNGMAANPESCLLALKKADRIESSLTGGSGHDQIKRRGDAVKEPYNKVLDALYELVDKTKGQQDLAVARINDAFAQQQEQEQIKHEEQDEEEDQQEVAASTEAKESAKRAQIEAVSNGSAAQIKLLSKTISFVWIALMRAMRRVQGQGKVDDEVGGLRNTFAQARKRGRLTSDVYVANAYLEYHCYKSPSATKIFEKGIKLFPEDAFFALEYLKHLIAINDITNARAVFETTTNRLTSKPENVQNAKPLFQFFHEYESQYGELTQISRLEERMAKLYPEDSPMGRFAHRFANASQTFDPTGVRPIISTNAQMRPKVMPPPPAERPASAQNSPRPSTQLLAGNSPKRGLPMDESDNEPNPPKRLARGESPLKGAAGRRMAQRSSAQSASKPDPSPTAKQQEAQNAINQILAQSAALPVPQAPQPLPGAVEFLLSVIPHARTYQATRLEPGKVVNLLRGLDLGRANVVQHRAVSQAGYVPQPQPINGQFGGMQMPLGYGNVAGGFAASATPQFGSGYSGTSDMTFPAHRIY